MNGLNVLIGLYLEPDLLDRIERLDKRVALLNRRAPPLEPSDGFRASFPERLLPLLAETEVLFTLRVPPRIVERALRLRWVQAHSAGLDTFVTPDLHASDIAITTAAGVHAEPLAETVLAAILALAKGFPQALRRQARHEWLRSAQTEPVMGRMVGIIGAGHIGTRVAELCQAVGMRVVGIRRSVEDPRGPDGPFDLLLPPRDLPRLLAESDYVVITAPRTPETAGLIGRDELARMKPGSCLINVARGGLVDEAALVGSLRSGHLAGAYLDVFRTEPLPPDSPLWDLPNVLLTSHSVAATAGHDARVTDVFLTNLRRYLDGEPLLNLYHRDRGY